MIKNISYLIVQIFFLTLSSQEAWCMDETALDVQEHPSKQNRLPNIRVLVADDNAVCQLILSRMLTNGGCSVTTVKNGQEAIEAITNAPYDIVLMDAEMPVMSGFTAAAKIRKTFDKKRLPIIGVTAHTQKADLERVLQAGMNSYLTKPIRLKTLYSEILKYFPAQ